MTADVELLPLPRTLQHADDADLATHVQDYTRANVAHHTAAKDAEIEALRKSCEGRTRMVYRLHHEIGALRAHLDLTVKQNDRLLDEGRELTARAEPLKAEIEALRAEARDLRKRQAGWERHVASAGCEYVREGERDVLVNRRAERLAEALRWYANPEVYKPHPHGPAFDDRDLSFKARAALRDHDKEGK